MLVSHVSITILLTYVQTSIYSIVSLVQTFTARIYHATYTRSNHPYSLHITMIRRKLYPNSFFPRTTTLWGIQKRCFPNHYGLNHFKSRGLPLPIIHIPIIFTLYFLLLHTYSNFIQ